MRVGEQVREVDVRVSTRMSMSMIGRSNHHHHQVTTVELKVLGLAFTSQRHVYTRPSVPPSLRSIIRSVPGARPITARHGCGCECGCSPSPSPSLSFKISLYARYYTTSVISIGGPHGGP